MQRSEMLSTIGPLLQKRALRMLLAASPAVTAAVAILSASESNLALAIVLNAAAGIIVTGALLIAVSMVARQIADERVSLAQATEEGLWRGRAQRLSIRDGESGLYADWYLRLRLEEEIERSRRYDQQFALLRVKASGLRDDAQAQVTSGWIGDQIRRRELRQSDLPALLRDGSVGIVLPRTERRGAQAVQRRLSEALASVNAQVGLACFPEDGEDAMGLLTAAARAAVGEPPETAVA